MGKPLRNNFLIIQFWETDAKVNEFEIAAKDEPSNEVYEQGSPT